MTLYVDTSALMKRYVKERDTEVAVELMASDPMLLISLLTEVELRRNLARLLEGTELLRIRRRVQTDLEAFGFVSLDATTFADAARIAEQTLCRSVDAIHIAAARRAGELTTFLTFDLRQAQAARSVGLSVVGV